jgi:eight-cysteine-cluster-containing protein
MILRALILALFLGVPAVHTAAPELDSLTVDSRAGTSTFYIIRRDLRRCASPLCGGYFIKLVNQSRTRCANGRHMSECYVANIEWNGQPEPQKDGALVRGSLSTRGDRRGKYGVLSAREVWLPGADKQPSGTFYRVRDRGIRCIAAPCETHHEAQLNSTLSRNIAGVDLSGAGASAAAVSEANTVLTGPDGVLVAGVHNRVTGPAGRSQMLKATQFYLRAKPGGTSGNDNQNKPCFKTGCSGQVCADEEVVTTCEYRPEYECYKTAKCERQANGNCGFTDTPELRRCLRRN